jgi:hypothetical protein
VILTLKAFNRPRYLYQCLKSLSSQDEIVSNRCNILVGLDASKTQDEMVAIIDLFPMLRHKTQIFRHTKQKGCAGNTRFLLSKAFEEYDEPWVLHIEDDAVMGRDCMRWLTWASLQFEKNSEVFAACSFVRATDTHLTDVPKSTEQSPGTSFYRPWFETGGPFSLPRREWDRINTLGGLYGATGECNVELSGEKWKEHITVTDKGSWGWPINKHLRRDMICVYPDVSRSQNIGADGGLFNPGAAWHAKHIVNPNWIDAKMYSDIDPTTLEYTMIDRVTGDDHSL